MDLKFGDILTFKGDEHKAVYLYGSSYGLKVFFDGSKGSSTHFRFNHNIETINGEPVKRKPLFNVGDYVYDPNHDKEGYLIPYRGFVDSGGWCGKDLKYWFELSETKDGKSINRGVSDDRLQAATPPAPFKVGDFIKVEKVGIVSEVFEGRYGKVIEVECSSDPLIGFCVEIDYGEVTQYAYTNRDTIVKA